MKFKKAAVCKLWIIAVIKQDQWTSSRSYSANEEILFGFFWLIKTGSRPTSFPGSLFFPSLEWKKRDPGKEVGSCRYRLTNAISEWIGKTVNTSPSFCQLIGSLISSVLISYLQYSFFIATFLYSYHYNLLPVTFQCFFPRLVVNFNTILELPFSMDHICVELILKDSVSFIGDLKSGILYQSQ